MVRSRSRASTKSWKLLSKPTAMPGNPTADWDPLAPASASAPVATRSVELELADDAACRQANSTFRNFADVDDQLMEEVKDGQGKGSINPPNGQMCVYSRALRFNLQKCLHDQQGMSELHQEKLGTILETQELVELAALLHGSTAAGAESLKQV